MTLSFHFPHYSGAISLEHNIHQGTRLFYDVGAPQKIGKRIRIKDIRMKHYGFRGLKLSSIWARSIKIQSRNEGRLGYVNFVCCICPAYCC